MLLLDALIGVQGNVIWPAMHYSGQGGEMPKELNKRSKAKAGLGHLPRPRSSAWSGATARRNASEKVDEIFRQWEIERPDIDASPVHIYGLIGQLYFQTTAFINEVLGPFGLFRGTFDVLTALRRAGPPYLLTPKQLSTSLLLSAAGLTSRLNRLESMHLIARLPEPSDRRTVKVQLTAAGEALVNQVLPLVFEAQWQRVLPLGGDGQKHLVEALTQFANVVAMMDEASTFKQDGLA
jgi:DNA-binding MarR family transcriptional regulator